MSETPLILLVEDNLDDEDLARLAIESSGVSCQVQVARDGAEVLNILLGPPERQTKGSNVPPSLVLLDLKMPKVSGLEVLQRLRSDPRTKHLPVVVLTSSSERHDLADAYKFGASGFVRKPIDLEDFNRAMSNICAFWLQSNEPPPAPTEV